MDENEVIAKEIIYMKDADLRLRQKLADSGELYNGYNKEMEIIHIKNAKRLNEIIDEIGWPSIKKVGKNANDAAMIIVQHSISSPSFQKKCLQLIEESVECGEESKRNYAFLFDRICFNERKPQKFGTQYDWDENGMMSPWKTENPHEINKLRSEFELNPIEEETENIRKGIKESGEKPPRDFAKRQKEIEEWCKKTGWI